MRSRALASASVVALSAWLVGCPSPAERGEAIGAAGSTGSAGTGDAGTAGSAGSGGTAAGAGGVAGSSGASGAVPPPSVQWAVRFGVEGTDAIDAVAPGPEGSLLLGGRWEEKLFFGSTVAKPGGGGAFVGRLDDGGKAVWSTVFSLDAVSVRGLASDASGSAYVVGRGVGSLTLGPAAKTGPAWVPSALLVDGPYVLKVGADGTALWQQRLAEKSSGARAVAVVDGVPVVAGTFSNALDVGDTSLVAIGASDIWLARLDPGTGKPISALRVGGLALDLLPRLVAPGDGSLVLAGTCEGPVTFGSELTPRPCDGVFVARLVGLDVVAWTSFVFQSPPKVLELTTAPDGTIFVAGQVVALATWGSAGLVAPLADTPFVGVLAPDLTPLAISLVGGSGTTLRAAAYDPSSQRLLATGGYRGALFGLTSAPDEEQNVWIGAFSPSLAPVWTLGFPSDAPFLSQEGTGLAVVDGRPWLGATLSQRAFIGGQLIESAGKTDMVLVRFK